LLPRLSSKGARQSQVCGDNSESSSILPLGRFRLSSHSINHALTIVHDRDALPCNLGNFLYNLVPHIGYRLHGLWQWSKTLPPPSRPSTSSQLWYAGGCTLSPSADTSPFPDETGTPSKQRHMTGGWNNRDTCAHRAPGKFELCWARTKAAEDRLAGRACGTAKKAVIVGVSDQQRSVDINGDATWPVELSQAASLRAPNNCLAVTSWRGRWTALNTMIVSVSNEVVTISVHVVRIVELHGRRSFRASPRSSLTQRSWRCCRPALDTMVALVGNDVVSSNIDDDFP